VDTPEHDPDDPRPEPPERPRLEVNGTQVCASALASVSAAVIGSFFGVTDTLVGAAIASVVATLGSAVYGLGIRRGHERLKDTEATTRIASLTRLGGVATAATRPAGKGAGDDDREPPAWRVWMSERRRGVLAGIGVVFLLTLGVITAIELVAQRPLAGVGDGDSSGLTSIGQVIRGDASGSGADDPGVTTVTTTGSRPSTTQGPSPSSSPAEAEPRSDAPTTEADASGEESTTTSTSTPSDATTTTTATPSSLATDSAP
jgi:hypothetical protein